MQGDWDKLGFGNSHDIPYLSLFYPLFLSSKASLLLLSLSVSLLSLLSLPLLLPRSLSGFRILYLYYASAHGVR